MKIYTIIGGVNGCGKSSLTGDDETTAQAVNGVFLRVLKNAQ